MLLHPMVQQHIARATVETAHLAVRGKQGQIGEAADIDKHPRLVWRMQQPGVERGYQWCSLTAGCHVPVAEVGDDLDAAQLGQQGGSADLYTEAQLGMVANGLAVTADGADIGGAQVVLLKQL